MKCEKCGNELLVWDKECEVCGEKVSNDSNGFVETVVEKWILNNKAISVLAIIIIYLVLFK